MSNYSEFHSKFREQYENWNYEGRVAVNLLFGNALASMNTRLLKTYVRLRMIETHGRETNHTFVKLGFVSEGSVRFLIQFVFCDEAF